MNETNFSLLIERLTILEYAIRKSMTVREDQDENAEPAQRAEAQDCGIDTAGLDTKGDLLNAVQTAVRAKQAQRR